MGARFPVETGVSLEFYLAQVKDDQVVEGCVGPAGVAAVERALSEFSDMVHQEIGERFDEHAGKVEEEADNGEDVNKSHELIEEITAQDADSEGGKDDAKVFAEEGFKGKGVVDEGLGGLEDGKNDKIQPKIAIEAGIFFFFEEPAAKEDQG